MSLQLHLHLPSESHCLEFDPNEGDEWLTGRPWNELVAQTLDVPYYKLGITESAGMARVYDGIALEYYILQMKENLDPATRAAADKVHYLFFKTFEMPIKNALSNEIHFYPFNNSVPKHLEKIANQGLNLHAVRNQDAPEEKTKVAKCQYIIGMNLIDQKDNSAKNDGERWLTSSTVNGDKKAEKILKAYQQFKQATAAAEISLS